MLKEFDIVELVKDRNELNLCKGQKGTIVDLYLDSNTFEVEFLDEKGKSLTVATLSGSDIAATTEDPAIAQYEHVNLFTTGTLIKVYYWNLLTTKSNLANFIIRANTNGKEKTIQYKEMVFV